MLKPQATPILFLCLEGNGANMNIFPGGLYVTIVQIIILNMRRLKQLKLIYKTNKLNIYYSIDTAIYIQVLLHSTTLLKWTNVYLTSGFYLSFLFSCFLNCSRNNYFFNFGYDRKSMESLVIVP